MQSKFRELVTRNFVDRSFYRTNRPARLGLAIKSGREWRQGMTTHSYTVLVSKENGGYRAHCPALPGCRSYGETKKEAVNNIKLSISYRLETLIAKGKPIPRDGDLARSPQKSA